MALATACSTSGCPAGSPSRSGARAAANCSAPRRSRSSIRRATDGGNAAPLSTLWPSAGEARNSAVTRWAPPAQSAPRSARRANARADCSARCRDDEQPVERCRVVGGVRPSAASGCESRSPERPRQGSDGLPTPASTTRTIAHCCQSRAAARSASPRPFVCQVREAFGAALRDRAHVKTKPAFTGSTCPVSASAPGVSRNTTVSTMSSGACGPGTARPVS